MASRLLTDLRYDVKAACEHFLNLCATTLSANTHIIITCTYRSEAEQAALYAIGRTKPGKRVTNAKPGESMHNHIEGGKPASLAFDVAPLRDGKLVWGTIGDDLVLWQSIGSIGESCGLEWAGRWKTFKEFPHFQISK